MAGDGIGVLAAGATETGSATHVVTQAEIDAGSVTNIADVTGTAPSGASVSGTNTQTVILTQRPYVRAIQYYW